MEMRKGRTFRTFTTLRSDAWCTFVGIRGREGGWQEMEIRRGLTWRTVRKDSFCTYVGMRGREGEGEGVGVCVREREKGFYYYQHGRHVCSPTEAVSEQVPEKGHLHSTRCVQRQAQIAHTRPRRRRRQLCAQTVWPSPSPICVLHPIGGHAPLVGGPCVPRSRPTADPHGVASPHSRVSLARSQLLALDSGRARSL